MAENGPEGVKFENPEKSNAQASSCALCGIGFFISICGMIGLSAIDALKQNPVYQEFPFDDNNLRKSKFLK